MTDHTATRPADALTMPVEDLPKLATRADLESKVEELRRKVEAAETRPTDGRPSPVEDAFTYTTDRLDRLEHVLGNLNGVVMRAGSVLEPLLTGGEIAEPETNPRLDEDTTPEDRRSTRGPHVDELAARWRQLLDITKRVTRLGLRTDNLTDAAQTITHRLEAILDGLEL